MRLAATIATALLVLLAASLSSAQSFPPRTSIEGTVTDLTDSTLPGASIVITDEDTGFERFVISNAQGLFRALDLPHGRYRVLVQLHGFKQLSITGVATTLGRPTVVDAALSVGDFTEVETRTFHAPVRSRAAQFETAQRLDAGELEILPLPTRNPADAALFDARVAGTAIAGWPEPITNVNGLPYRSRFSVDGVGDSSNAYGFGLLVPLPEIAVAAATLATVANAPEAGATTGLLFNAVTPDGGTRVRGGARYMFRRDSFSAHEPSVADGAVSPAAQLDDVSGTVGGPLRVAGLRYFAGYERLARDLRFDPALQAPPRGSSTASSVLGQAGFWFGPATRVSVRHLNVQRGASISAPAVLGPLDDSSHSTTVSATTLIGARRLNDVRVQYSSDGRGFLADAAGLDTLQPVAQFSALGERDFEIAEAFSFIRNNHTYKVGLDEHWIQADAPVGNGEQRLRPRLHAYYIEDDWRVNARLRLLYGLRYDVYGLPAGLTVADNNSIGPRFALSWTPNARTVIRASTGIASDDPMLALLARASVSPDFEIGRSWQNTVNVERAIGAHYAVDATYVFAQHRHLPVLSAPDAGSLFALDPALLTLESSNDAHYNGVSLQLRRRFVNGFAFTVGYVAAGPAAPALPAQAFTTTLTYVVPPSAIGSFASALRRGHELGMVIRAATGVSADPQNSDQLPGASNVDVRYAKRFAVGGSVSADLIAELANVFNTDQRFAVPPIVPVRLTVPSPLSNKFFTGTSPPRQLQLGLRLRF